MMHLKLAWNAAPVASQKDLLGWRNDDAWIQLISKVLGTNHDGYAKRRRFLSTYP
jgi:hypothetical protein